MRSSAILVFGGLLAGCAAGPDFQRPTTSLPASYTATAVASETGSAPTPLGQSQHLVAGLAIDAQWWRKLESSALNSLIDEALANSPTLDSARAALRQSQELYAAQAGATQYPNVNLTTGAQRQNISPSAQGKSGDTQTFSLYSTNVGVRYNLDLAGGNRRALEAMLARTEHRLFELNAARLTLASEVSGAAITRARLAAQADATQAILLAQEEQYSLAQKRERIGHATPDEVLSLQAQMEQLRAELPLLHKQLQQTEHRLAVLAGRAPGAGGIPVFTLNGFTLPAELPLAIPSELLRQRPDIQAAEALLHVATAEYGVATARLYPQFEISASLGAQALTTGALFGGSAVWSLFSQLTQPLFNPSLPAEKRAALAALDAAAANYQQVVLEALRNVADILVALDHDTQSLAALVTAHTAALGAMESMQRQYALGAASYIQLLTAQQQVEESRNKLIAAQAQRLTNSVALYQAMGSAEPELHALRQQNP